PWVPQTKRAPSDEKGCGWASLGSPAAISSSTRCCARSSYDDPDSACWRLKVSLKKTVAVVGDLPGANGPSAPWYTAMLTAACDWQSPVLMQVSAPVRPS